MASDATSTVSGLPTLLRAPACVQHKSAPEQTGSSVGPTYIVKQALAPSASAPALSSQEVRRRPSSAGWVRSSGPSATFGTGPGHRGLHKVSASPGPGDYWREGTFRIPGGSLSLASRDRDCNNDGRICEERRQFRHLDQNRNGVLDFDEACVLFRRGDPTVQDLEVRALFDLVDVSRDGKIQFQELHDFLFSSGPKGSAWRTRLREAMNLVHPGPGQYTGNGLLRSQHKQPASPIIAKGPRLDNLGWQMNTPGPGAYAVKYSSILPKCPRATFGTGPGHQSLDAWKQGRLGRPRSALALRM
eukprot:TRINITY_DN95597_c0_g1_i1.p1 TRINITY_DN95597_c0_g1~~TRINITY_DN95597_c0_g1_i1.p1  ORF type:complete len:302 (-),score=27.39 TRINITY_DN95597_c0_g1_i1:107-1012(-)